MNDIVLLTVDSLRYDYIFNEDGDVRDGLDSISDLSHSADFCGKAWSTGANTVDSFPAIMSGEYQWAYSPQRKGFESSRPHIAEELGSNGYTTGGFHSNVYLKERFGYGRGFDHYSSSGGTDSDSFGPLDLIEKIATMNEYTEHIAYKTMNLVGQRFGIDLRGKPYTPAEKLNQQAKQWVTDQPAPVFLWVHYMDIHSPWYSRNGTPSEGLTDEELAKAYFSARDLSNDLDESTYEVLRKGYEGELQHFDDKLGDFLAFLSRELSNPMVVFTSDHGELFGEDDLVLHPLECLHPKILEVPFIVKGAGDRIRHQSPISTVDIFPTLIDFVTGDTPDSAGRSLLQEQEAERTVFAETGSRADGAVRVIGRNHSEVVDMSEATDYPEEVESHLRRIDGSRGTEMETYDESDVADRLEALGYKAE